MTAADLKVKLAGEPISDFTLTKGGSPNKLVFLVFDTTSLSFDLLSKSKKIAQSTVSLAGDGVRFVVMSIDPGAGLRPICGPTTDKEMVSESIAKSIASRSNSLSRSRATDSTSFVDTRQAYRTDLVGSQTLINNSIENKEEGRQDRLVATIVIPSLRTLNAGLPLEVRAKNPDITLTSVSSLARALVFAEMTEAEKQSVIKAVLSNGLVGDIGLEVSTGPAEVSENGEEARLSVQLPAELSQAEWDIYKVWRDSGKGTFQIEEEHALSESPLLSFRMTAKENTLQSAVLVQAKSGTVLVCQGKGKPKSGLRLHVLTAWDYPISMAAISPGLFTIADHARGRVRLRRD